MKFFNSTWAPRGIVFFLGVLLLVGCHRKIIGTLPLPPSSMEMESIDFDYLHGKAKLIFIDETKEREVKANIRIRKDSVIWMTLNVIGLQGGKVLVNKDSITIVSNLENEYYVYDYAELSKRFNFQVDYSVVQAALLGNLIVPKRTQDETSQDSFFNKLIQHLGSLTIQNLINNNTKKLEHVNIDEATTGNTVQANYADFQPVGRKLFPYKGIVDVTYKTPSGKAKSTIIFEYIKVEVGTKELRFPFNIPKRYARRKT